MRTFFTPTLSYTLHAVNKSLHMWKICDFRLHKSALTVEVVYTNILPCEKICTCEKIHKKFYATIKWPHLWKLTDITNMRPFHSCICDNFFSHISGLVLVANVNVFSRICDYFLGIHAAVFSRIISYFADEPCIYILKICGFNPHMRPYLIIHNTALNLTCQKPYLSHLPCWT